MATYYCRTPANGGSDANPGSNAAPWATPSFAVGIIPDSAGHTLKIGEGVYAHNDSATGMARFVGGMRTNLLIVEAENPLYKPTIRGSNDLASTSVQLQCGNITWNNIRFSMPASPSSVSVKYGLRFNNSACGKHTFNGCVLDAGDCGAASGFTLYAGSYGAPLLDINFNGCEVHGSKVNPAGWFVCKFDEVDGGVTGNWTDTITTGRGFNLENWTGTFTRGSSSTLLGIPMSFGRDSHLTGKATNVSGTDVFAVALGTSASQGTHGLLFGNGYGGGTFSRVHAFGRDYGVVIKATGSLDLSELSTVAGVNTAKSGILFKGSTGEVTITDSIIRADGAGAEAFSFTLNDANVQPRNVNVHHNRVILTNGAVVYNVATADLGVNVSFDYQVVSADGTSEIGLIKSGFVSPAKSWEAARAAWGNTNDANSRFTPTAYEFSGAEFPRVFLAMVG